MTDDLMDGGALERLEEWGGEALRNKMIDLFLENAPERVAGVRAGLTGDDLELAERSAHSLKSSAANLGAEAVRRLSSEIESSIEGGDAETARSLLIGLEERFSQTVEALSHARGDVVE